MFFFPYSDDNPPTDRPYVCYWLIAICVFVFLWQSSLPTNLSNEAVYNFGVVPASLLGDQESYIAPSLSIFYVNVYAWKLDASNWKYGFSILLLTKL